MPELLQTIPAEEGALLQKPKASLRRVIVADAPSPSGGACNKYCPSGKDSECSWFGGANSCTKCDTTPGTRFQCVAP